MTESATPSSLAPPSDAALLRLAGKLREVDKLFEGIFESSRWNG
jgi:hypothetical protein